MIYLYKIQIKYKCWRYNISIDLRNAVEKNMQERDIPIFANQKLHTKLNCMLFRVCNFIFARKADIVHVGKPLFAHWIFAKWQEAYIVTLQTACKIVTSFCMVRGFPFCSMFTNQNLRVKLFFGCIIFISKVVKFISNQKMWS